MQKLQELLIGVIPTWLLVLVVGLVVVYLSILLTIAVFRGQEVHFWPPWIGPKSDTKPKGSTTKGYKVRDLKGKWTAQWYEFGLEELVIENQDGNQLSGTRTLHRKNNNSLYYNFKGQLVGNHILVAYCTPQDNSGTIAGTIILRVLDGHTMQGRVTGLKDNTLLTYAAPSNDAEENTWTRQS